ncbi:MAG: glycosyltransferase [Chromatiaceae bacterium]
MNITYISFARIPSLEANAVQIMKMCDAFARLGHDVELHIPHYAIQWTYEPVDDPYAYYGVERIFRILKLPPWAGMRPGYRHSTFYSALSALRAAWRGGTAFGRDLRSCALAARLGVPVAIELHGPVERGSRWFSLLLKSRNLRQVVVISDALRRIMLDKFPELEGRILVAHDGADSSSDPAVTDEYVVPNEGVELRAGYVGSLYQGRGIELIIELARRLPWVWFDVVGGAPAEVLAREREAEGLANIRFHGHLSYDQAAALRNRADVLLAPYQRNLAVAGGGSDTSQWMSPIKVFEYMAAGRAIVCSDLPVLREVLSPGHTAILCDPGCGEAWAAALERLRDPSLRRVLGRAARREFEARYSWTRRAEGVLQAMQ